MMTSAEEWEDTHIQHPTKDAQPVIHAALGEFVKKEADRKSQLQVVTKVEEVGQLNGVCG